MRVLVTGGNGFVGRYLATAVRERGNVVVVAGHAREGAADVTFDLLERSSLSGLVESAKPDVIFHLAAQASTSDAARDPLAAYETNVLGSAALFEAMRSHAPAALFVFVSSGEVYGAQPIEMLPVKETALPRPATIYAASKAAAEDLVLGAARAHRLRAIVLRPFNLIGPGQSDRFVVAAFAKRLAAIAAGGPSRMGVGNLTPQRDFLDVRDAVAAYVAIAEHGVAGETYNVCSGVPTSVQTVLRELVLVARVPVEIREDPALVRPAEVAVLYGDNAKLRSATGWEPAIALRRTLREIYEHELAAARAAKSEGIDVG